MCSALGEFRVCMCFVFFDFDFVFMCSAFNEGFGLCFRVLASVFVFVGCFCYFNRVVYKKKKMSLRFL